VRIEILDEAEADLIAGFHFYERQEAGLGGYFLDSLFSDIDSLLVYAGIHDTIYGHRRCLSRRFPFEPGRLPRSWFPKAVWQKKAPGFGRGLLFIQRGGTYLLTLMLVPLPGAAKAPRPAAPPASGTTSLTHRASSSR